MPEYRYSDICLCYYAMRMMKHVFLFAVLLFFCLEGQGQEDTVLLRINSKKDDSAKVDALLRHGDELINSDQKKAKEVYQQGLRLSQMLKYRNGIAYSWLKCGYVETLAGNYRLAIKYYNTAIEKYKPINKLGGITRALTNIGAIYELMGKPDSSMASYLECIKLLENTTDYYSLGNAYCSMGVVYGNTKVYDKAIYYKLKAVAIGRQQKDSSLLMEALTEIADTYGEMAQPEKGFPFAYEALPITLASKNSAAMGSTFYTLSALHLANGNADSAIYYAQRCMHYCLLSGDINTYMGGALCLSGGYDHLNAQQQRKRVLSKALQQSMKAGAVMLLDDIYKNLADASYKTGDYKRAYDYFSRYSLYKDSVLNERMNRSVGELEIKYQTAKKEHVLSQNKLQLAQKDLQLQKNRYYMNYTLTALMVALLVVALLFLRAKHKKRLHQNELKSIQQQKELQLLQALMKGEEKERSRIAKDLHDGVAGMLAAVKMHFSSMPAADEISHTEGYRQGMKLLNEATHEIRKTSHNLMPEVLLQHGLDEALRRFCNNVNNSRTLQMQYDSWGEINRFDDGFELSVYRIVQELVNNIIKHSKATQAMVQLNQRDDLLTLSIEDNGIGFSQTNESEGMGLQSLQSRIKAMNGKLEIESSEQSGVSAYLEFEISALKKEIAV